MNRAQARNADSTITTKSLSRTHEDHEETPAPIVFVIFVKARRAFVVLKSGGGGVSAAEQPLTAGLAKRGERTTTARVGVGLHRPERRL